MDKEIVTKHIGIPVRITIGNARFTPPPGTIETVTDDYFTFKTHTKTSVIALSELKEINPVC